MKNELVLENYGVQELQAVEKQEVDGGNPWWILLPVGVALRAVDEIISDWEGFKAGWNGTKEPPKN